LNLPYKTGYFILQFCPINVCNVTVHGRILMKSLKKAKNKSFRLIAVGFSLLLLSSLVMASKWQSITSFAQEIGAGFWAAPVAEKPASDLTTTAQNSSLQKQKNDDRITIGTCDTAGPIEVEATAGTTGPTAYTNLTAAIAAINAGTHQGAINIEVCGNSTETAAIVLNGSGAGSALYTSISMYPLADGLSISGPSVTGRGLIELNGADNVTIDGDNPNSAGTNRNLTIQNTAVNTVAFTMVIRVAVAATIITSADNNTFKNLNLIGSATGRNAAANTSTTGSQNQSYVVYAGGGASTVSTTTAPTAISSATTTVGTGATMTNLTVQNNNAQNAARAIAAQGAATTVFPGLLIENNLVGNSTAGAVDQVYSMGITVQGSTNAIVRGNTVYVESWLGTALRGIDQGSISATGTGTVIEKNKVNRVRNNNAGTFGAYGINLTGGNTHTVRNNFVSDVRSDQTAGTGAFDITNAANGIRVNTGTGHKIYHNAVNLYGTVPGTTSTLLSCAFTITGTGLTGLDVRNNIFSNQSTGGNPTGTSTRHAVLCLPSGGTSAMNLNLNNNDYFQGPSNAGALSLLAQVGTTAGTGEFLAANFNAGATTPASNLRSYTSTLSAAGTNDNASTVANPLFVSDSDLHIQVGSPMESAGVDVGVTDDIDNQARPQGPVPDIGADEIPLPLVPGTLQFNNSAYSAAEGTSATITVNRTGGSLGSVTVDYATVAGGTATGGASCSGGVDYVNTSGTLTFANGVTSQTFMVQLCSDALTKGNETINLALTNATGGATIGAQNTATLTITDVVIFNGSVNVGTGEGFTSLTNAGGLFQTLNNGIVTGNVTVNITSDLTAETGAIFLNQLNETGAGAGTYTVTIKPSGAARVISGTNGTGALVRLNGADRVTIDGSTSGGTDRSLTITNNSTATNTAAIHISSLGAGAGSTDVTIKNTNLSCGADQSTSVNVTYGISQGNALLGNSGADNDNNSFINNAITKVNVGIYSSGESAANQVQNTVIANNLIGPAAFGADQIGRAGIIFNLTNNGQVTGNEVRFVGVTDAQTSSGGSYDKFGITHAFNGWSDTTFGDLAVSNTTIARNKVHDIVEENTFSAVGIFMAGGNGANVTANTTVNNFIWNVRANGTSGDNGVSLGIASGTGDTVAFNSIYMAGDLDPLAAAASSQSSFGIQITSTTVVNLNLKNNISYTDMTSNTATLKHGSIKIPASFVWGTGGSNYNDFYVPAANTQAIVGRVNLTDAVTLTDWQTATSQDANSVSINPPFVSATDLHLQAGSTLLGIGTPIAGVTTDIDGQTRDAVPDIGADEIVSFVAPTVQFNSATYSGAEGASVTVTVTRTGDTSGASTVNYATSNGTATGGASCGAGVDYVNASGTLNYAATETSKTFNVQLCSDAVSKGSETVNLTLSSPTGATLGAQSTAVLTITNVAPPMPGSVQFAQAFYTVGEGAGSVTLTVTRTGGSDGAISVGYSFLPLTATGGASCGAGVDFAAVSGTLNWANGDSASKTFNVAICEDALVEGSENFLSNLSSPTGGATIGSQSSTDVTITDNDSAGPVTVTATAGTASGSYTDLTAAIAAVNDGTHQGDIVISINQSTTEAGTIVLNSTGAGAAVYTSLLIRPTADSLTVSGASATGRGLLELNGADNVTIDGDNPNSAGTNRNLTFQNTAANTVTFTSVIRIALAASVTSADGDTFKNLRILGSATGRNIAAANTTTGTENNSFGIFAGLGATGATTAPAAITSVTTGAPTGTTANNLVISNNSVTTTARGISINGAVATVFPGMQVTGNSVGNPTAGATDQVYTTGITAQGSPDGLISGNTVWVEGFAATAVQGINVATNTTVGTYTVELNKVNRVRNNNVSTFGAYGINLGGSTNHVVRNNFVSGVINDQTAGTGAFSTTFGAFGIRILGTGNKVYHNSVHLYGVMPGSVSTNLTAALCIVGTTQTGLDIRNNIFSNQISGGNPTGTRNVAVALPTGGTSAMNLTLNNNAYFAGGDALNRLAQVGVTFGTGEFLVGNFDPTSTTPATNFRAYTSTLSAAGTNDNASFATTAPPPFTSDVDLHIPAGTATRLESGGAAVGVTTDIDNGARNATTPDIGADEFAGLPAPANDIAAVALLVPANGSTVLTGAAFTPQARFNNNGTATQTNVTVRFRIIDSSMVVIYNQTATIATIAPLQNVDVSFPSTSVVNPGTYTMEASAELAGDANPGNNTISGSFTAVAPIAGTVTVGTGGTYPSLTNPGGLFAALNLAGISGNLTVDITSDLTAETGAVALNQVAESGAGGYTITIKPSGAARTISGTAAANIGLINLNGADRIVFDGSLSGGNDRSLTITNNQTGTSTVIWIRSASAANGSNNNTIKNCIINGAIGATATTTAGILTGSGVTIGADAEAANSNNTIQNNWIYRVQNSMYLRGGATAPVFDQNWVVTDNEMGSVASTADKNTFRGMLIGNAQNFTITRNVVHGIQSTTTTTAAMSGIQLGLLLSTGTVTNNNISDIKNVSATGTGAAGISVIATSTASNVTIANNFVSDVATLGSATLTSNGFGISFNSTTGGSGYNVYFNSVNLNTNQGAAQTSAAMFVNSTFATAGALNVRNNIFANTQTTGTRFAFYSLAAANVYTAIDYNDYFAQNVGFIGGSARTTLTDWQTGTGQDANSKAVDPLFVSATNLHLQPSSPLLGMAVSGTGITTDIDGQTRETPPDIGADELLAVATPGSVQFSSANYSVNENGGTVTLTVTRTGGTSGAISVTYATASGTATGAIPCAAGVDFVSTNGMLNWADGDSAPKTFNVTICNDAVFEPSETFTLTLSGATGGATVGTPNPATVTITDDDPAPSGTITVSDVRVFEGNTGGANAVFTVTYSGPNAASASVQYATANGRALAGIDYVPVNGTLNFSAGTSLTVAVPIIGKTLKEANETFFLNLSNPVNATISDGQGVGIIIDEDRTYVADFDRDLYSDLSLFRPSDGKWYIFNSSNAASNIVSFGTSGDRPVPGDYDGDGLTDIAVYRPSQGAWYVISSSNASVKITNWGTTGDKPVQGDYDGDGKTDIAIYRPSTGQWWIIRSSDSATYTVNFGISTDRLVQGDYDGDFKTDQAVYRDGTWYILQSSNGAAVSQNFGLASDRPVSGDFDGDGKYDLAVYRDGTWWVYNSLTGTAGAFVWGTTGDIPVPADYDRDGTTDYAIFRPSTGQWFIFRSSNGSYFVPNWGTTGDIPIPSAYLPQ
jgi:hypothetical protein